MPKVGHADCAAWQILGLMLEHRTAALLRAPWSHACDNNPQGRLHARCASHAITMLAAGSH
eukprot:1745722-Alexandrium_andersonii.AAC.1